MLEHLQTEITLLAGGFTAVVSILLSLIIHELRVLRKDLKTCVPDKFCKVMMTEHENRIKKLENKVEEK